MRRGRSCLTSLLFKIVFTWTAMVSGSVQNKMVEEARVLFDKNAREERSIMERRYALQDMCREVESCLNDCEAFIPWQLSRCNCLQDIIETMSMGDHVTCLYRLATIKTGWRDSHVEKRLHNLDIVRTDILEWAASGNPSSLLMVFLKHGIGSVNTTASTLNVRRVHALALTTGMLEDEWNRSRMIPLYLQSATSSLDAEHWVSVKDFCEAISTVDHLVSLYRQTAAETGCKDRFLEKKLEKMIETANDLEDWVASKNPSSLVMIYLKHALVGSVNTIATTRNVKRVHALALKTGTLEDDWNRSRLIGLYLQSSTCTLVDCERLFHGAERKGLFLYNQMLTVYSRHDPEKAKRLFDEMIRTCPPNGATYMALLHALSLGGETGEAIKVIGKMESCGVQPEPRHYGAVVDSFARKRTPGFIKGAIAVLKYFPTAQNEVTINAILSRCVPPAGVKAVSAKEELDLKERLKQALDELYHPETFKHFQDVLDLQKIIRDAQDVLELQEIIRDAQDLVDYLEEKECKYAVQEKTHWRLAKCGLKWPRRVTKN